MQAKVFYFSFLVFLSFILFSVLNYSQISDLKQIPLQYQVVKVSASVIISDNELLFFISIQRKILSFQ